MFHEIWQLDCESLLQTKQVGQHHLIKGAGPGVVHNTDPRGHTCIYVMQQDLTITLANDHCSERHRGTIEPDVVQRIVGGLMLQYVNLIRLQS